MMHWRRTIGLPMLALCAAPVLGAAAQDAESVGRGWPLGVTEILEVGGFNDAFQGPVGGEPPSGIEALETDMFTTTDFYQDVELWTDPRYFRCNSPRALTDMWSGGIEGREGERRIGENPPHSARWGNCDADYPRDAIVSPYPFETAQEHYEALLAESRANGSFVEHTRATLPDWDGRYSRNFEAYPNWNFGRTLQMTTYLSLLTPDYQTRAVQQNYHEAVSNAAQWPASYCWPEGFMRFWYRTALRAVDVMVTPRIVQLLGGTADNFVRHVQIGREFNMDGAVPRLGQDVARWYGETIGFWDEEALISWTSNVQPWTHHTMFEFSSQMQSVEILTPRHDEAGALVGLTHETVFYDPVAFVEPIRIVYTLDRTSDFTDAYDPYVYIRCLPTVFPIDGRAQPVTPGSTFEYFVYDMYDRPWAQIWETYHEEGMVPPEPTDVLFGF